MSGEAETSIESVWPKKGPYVRTMSPLVLPECVCARCGSRESGGEIRRDTVHHIPGWVYITAVVNLIVFMICYYARRKRLDVEYYLCPRCADHRKINRVTALVTALIAAMIFVTSLALSKFVIASYGLAVFAGAALAMILFQRAPMKAIAHDGSHFSVKHIAYEARRHLPDRLPPAQ